MDGDVRPPRPTTISPLTFDELAKPGQSAFPETRHLVPIERVRSGDQQVLAAGGAQQRGEIVDLDPLAEYPTVQSVVAATAIRARRPLPGVSELLLIGQAPLPDEQTLRNLPGLARLWAGFAWAGFSRTTQALAVDALPDTITALGVCRHVLGSGRSPSPKFGDLTRFRHLRALSLTNCWPKDSAAPLAELTELVHLRCDAPLGWSALRTCTALEEVAAIRPRIANLRSLRSWTRLRRLILTGSGIRSLSGMEAFTKLEGLRLIMLPVEDLSPLARLTSLTDVDLTGLSRVHSLAPLGTLPSLRRLIVARAGIEARDIVHVDSLRPLAAAQALEELTLDAAVVDDGDLGPLVELPSLRRVQVYGDLEAEVATLRSARPDLAITWFPAHVASGERVGTVFLHPPTNELPWWWLREDLTEALAVRTNADAEDRLRAALTIEDAAVLGRLVFDTEGDAVVVSAEREDDARFVAGVIARLDKRRRRTS